MALGAVGAMQVAFERVLRYARDREPWLLVCGRIGVHSGAAMDLGSNTDQLLRNAPCDVLISNRTHVPPIDLQAEAGVVWTPEAEVRMAEVPGGARGLARTAVLRWCMERGHSVVSSGDVDTALDELMPYRRTMRRIGEVQAAIEQAEQAMVEETPADHARAVCRVCGYAARAVSPAQCPVCGGDASNFDRIDEQALLLAAEHEGDATTTGFDGQKLGWTLDARRLLQELPAGYLRRRVKAIVEKQARTRRLPAITVEVAEPFIRPELDALDASAGPHRAPLGPERHTGPQVQQQLRLPWDAGAEERLERIPAGFLRNLAIEQIERLALALRAPQVTVLHVEAGIAEARARMQAQTASDAAPVAPGGGCPVPHHGNGNSGDATPRAAELNEVTAPVVDALGRRQT